MKPFLCRPVLLQQIYGQKLRFATEQCKPELRFVKFTMGTAAFKIDFHLFLSTENVLL